MHRYHEAGQTLWDFVWRDFCDWYLEAKKLRFREDSGQDDHWTAALSVYESMLRLLHPFMPFLTEELWQRLIADSTVRHRASISLERYPEPQQSDINEIGAQDFGKLQRVVIAARELRADNKLDPKSILQATLSRTKFSDEDLPLINRMANLKIAQGGGQAPAGQGLIRSTPEFDLQLHVSASGDKRARIVKEIASLEKAIEQMERRLKDPDFASRAPEDVRHKELQTYLADKDQLNKNRNLLQGLE